MVECIWPEDLELGLIKIYNYLINIYFNYEKLHRLQDVSISLNLHTQFGPVPTWEDKSIMSSVEERVKKIVVEQLGVKEDEVTNEASFVDDLGADSLDTVELVMALEEEFKTEIPDEEAEKITTVQQAVDYVSANLE